jgi:hypothetical protein
LRIRCGGKRGERIVGRGVGDLDQRLARRRVFDRERSSATRGAPLSADEKTFGEPIENGAFGSRC